MCSDMGGIGEQRAATQFSRGGGGLAAETESSPQPSQPLLSQLGPALVTRCPFGPRALALVGLKAPEFTPRSRGK